MGDTLCTFQNILSVGHPFWDTLIITLGSQTEFNLAKNKKTEKKVARLISSKMRKLNQLTSELHIKYFRTVSPNLYSVQITLRFYQVKRIIIKSRSCFYDILYTSLFIIIRIMGILGVINLFYVFIKHTLCNLNSTFS